MMSKFVRNSFIVLISIVVILSIVAFKIYRDEGVLFSVSDSSLSEDENGTLFTAVVTNRGNEPITINGCGYHDLRCKQGCGDISIINPGEEFIVEIECDLGVTADDLNRAGFYINNTLNGGSSSRTTSSGTFSFPSFDIRSGPSSGGSSSSSGGSSSGSSSSGSSSGSSGSSSSGSTASGGSSTSGTAGVNPGASAQTGVLDSPRFYEISGDQNQFNFLINDNTPFILAISPSPTANATLSRVNCKWSYQDVAFNQMSSSCSLDNSGLIICSLPIQSEGAHTYSVACSDGAVQNTANNNLDISGVIDSLPPSINDISPPTSNIFSSTTNSFVIQFSTNENGECKASSSSSSSTVSYNSMTISCGSGTTHSCTLPLAQGNNYVGLGCIDSLYNIGRKDLTYIKGSASSSSSSSTSSSSSSSGSSSGTNTDTSDPAPDGEISSDTVVEEGTDSGFGVAVVRDFDSNKAIFQSIIDWFKGLFRK